MKIIALFFIAFILAGTITSCKNQIAGNNPPADTTKKPLDTCKKPLDKIPPTWDQLHATTTGVIHFIGVHTYSNEGLLIYLRGVFPEWDFTCKPLVWLDSNFSYSTNMSGILDTSRMHLNSVEYSESSGYVHYSNGKFWYKQNLSLSLKGVSIPFTEFRGDTIVYSVSGPAVKDYLTVLLNDAYTDRSGSATARYVSTNWQDTVTPPQIIIKFYK